MSEQRWRIFVGNSWGQRLARVGEPAPDTGGDWIEVVPLADAEKLREALAGAIRKMEEIASLDARPDESAPTAVRMARNWLANSAALASPDSEKGPVTVEPTYEFDADSESFGFERWEFDPVPADPAEGERVTLVPKADQLATQDAEQAAYWHGMKDAFRDAAEVVARLSIPQTAGEDNPERCQECGGDGTPKNPYSRTCSQHPKNHPPQTAGGEE